MATRVQKGLSPEERTLIDNLKSMIAELESMEAGEAAGDDGVEAALKAVQGMAGGAPNEEQGGTKSPDLEAANRKKELIGQGAIGKSNKGQGSTDVDVPPAQADAEERIEELPEQDEENIGEVAKALAALMRRRGVGKSAEADPILMVAKALQAISDRLSVQETAVTKLLEGMGVADQIAAVEKAEERRPVGATDQEQVISMVAKALAGALQGKVNEVTADDKKSMAEVRKDLTSVLGAFGNSGLWNPINGVFTKG